MHRFKSRLSALILAFCGLTSVKGAEFANDYRVWNEFMMRGYEGERWKTYTWAELRWVDDVSELGTWFVQEKAYFEARPGLQLGGGASWIDSKNAAGDWSGLARVELEANPSWKLPDDAKLTLRNRLELRWLESRDWDTSFVSRHRFLYARKANWFGSMTRFEVSNEFFFDYREGRLNENRFRPLNLFFALTERVSYNVFTQIRSRRSANVDSWSHAYILGTGLRW